MTAIHHGFAKRNGKSKLYHVWGSLKDRCYRQGNKSFKYYGGKGIGVCEEWKRDFRAFREWSYSNGYKEGLQIDRINNDYGYSPDNCRWVTKEENMRNSKVAKIDRETAVRIKLIVSRGGCGTDREVANIFGISYRIVQCIRQGKTWKDV